MAEPHAHLLALIDAYALASDARAHALTYGSFAFIDAQARMVEARRAVAAALGIDPDSLVPLSDPATQLAVRLSTRQQEWGAEVRAAMAKASKR